jgi:hypothetical protein
VAYGRYELGSKENDTKRILHMQKIEKEAGSAAEAFRGLIDRDMERTEKK